MSSAPKPGRRCPTSYAQERLWFLEQMDPGKPTYNVARVLRIVGRLSVHALRRSLREIVARHEALRTTFADIDGTPMQLIAATGPLDMPLVDLSGAPASEREAEARRAVQREVQRPFDLRTGPLLRATLFRLGASEHVLALVMHHIVTDAWSMNVLYEEIGRLYEAFVAGSPSPLPPLPIQFGDFARRQREALRGEVLARHLAYWRRQLAGADPLLNLPGDRPYPAVRSGAGATQHRLLSRNLRDALNHVSRAADATLFMTLLAGFQTFLSRYTDREDLLIGSPTAGRTSVELERLIGFFVNTLVLRGDLAGDPPFRELLRRVRSVALDAFEHQDAPFETVVAELQPERSLGHTPLFQVMFVLQNARPQRLELPGLVVEEVEFETGTAKFDLTLEMAERDDGLWCAFEYSTDIFDHATVGRMLANLETLLESIAADPSRPLSALPLLAAPERHRLLAEWNDTAADYPRDRCIHQLFEAQARRMPDAIALVFRHQSLTYRELNTRANRLAERLRAHGVGPGMLIGIAVERGFEAVVGLLAILKAGAAYVPMDPSYPPERLAFMLQDSRAPVLLTTQRLSHRFSTGETRIIDLDTVWHTGGGEVPDRDSGVTSDDLAYVIYTSGSTGTPKGVLASHRACVNRFSWMWNAWPFVETDVCCQKTALSFVDSVWEVFGPLLQGVRNVIVPDEELTDLESMVGTLAAHRVTRVVLVPSFLHALLESIPDLSSRIPDLRLWISSGEPLTPELARRFAERLPGATLLNLYGSSEVAADVTSYVVTGDDSRHRIPIGRPIANTRIYVLDRASNPTPIGVPGEIYIGGDGLARGYLNDPRLTAERFVPDRFASERGIRLFRSGDRGRFLADGNLEFLGRADTQVKLRGFRIELGEIESALRAHPSVRDAAVILSETGATGSLIGYVVPSTASLHPTDLRRHLQSTLPDYMVPASIVVLGALPLLPNGKVDRHALPAPDHFPPSPGPNHDPPRTPTEDAVARIWADVLKRERIGRDENFFEVGGHSLLAMQVVARVRRVLQVELPVRRLFEQPTVAGLASEIEKMARSGVAVPPPIPRRPEARPIREQLLARLDRLSDEDVERLLERLRTQTDHGNGVPT